MGLNTGGEAGNAKTTTHPGVAPAEGQMAAAFGSANPRGNDKPNGAGFSFRNLGSSVRTAIGRTPASEALSKINKAVSELLKETPPHKQFEVTIIPVDMNATVSLGVSALVIAVRNVDEARLGTAFYSFILEASTEAPVPRFENFNGQNVEILRVIGDADDMTFNAAIGEIVSKQFSQQKLHNVGATVVPRDFSVTDQDALRDLVSLSIYACTTALEVSRDGFADINLANADRDSSLVVRTTFNNTQLNDVIKQPVRADVAIHLDAAPINQKVGDIHQIVERTSPISRIAGFVDLVWNPLNPMVNNPYAQQQNESFQRYAARFVMTTMECVPLLTLPAQLLALLPALTLRENNLWIQAFRPQSFVSSDVNLRDIGAIGIEVNFDKNPNGVGTRINTKTEEFSSAGHLGKLVAMTVQQGLILSLDVPECGPQSWFNCAFAMAAENTPKGAEWNQRIINAANVLTNGAFNRHFSANGQTVVNEGRIHLGYYTDRNGDKRDIRDIDYLAVLNLMGEKDPLVVCKWSDTFTRTDYPLNQRLSSRKQILNNLVSDLVITGFANRISFTSDFINALTKAVTETNTEMRSITPYADFGVMDRGVANLNSTLMSANNVGYLNRGLGGITGGGNFGTPHLFGGGRY